MTKRQKILDDPKGISAIAAVVHISPQNGHFEVGERTYCCRRCYEMRSKVEALGRREGIEPNGDLFLKSCLLDGESRRNEVQIVSPRKPYVYGTGEK